MLTQGRDNDAYAWTGAAPGAMAYGVNGLNQYTSVADMSPTYDANGNLQNGGSGVTYG